jgi:hypothetical protein
VESPGIPDGLCGRRVGTGVEARVVSMNLRDLVGR